MDTRTGNCDSQPTETFAYSKNICKCNTQGLRNAVQRQSSFDARSLNFSDQYYGRHYRYVCQCDSEVIIKMED